jgi:hypothetical protein
MKEQSAVDIQWIKIAKSLRKVKISVKLKNCTFSRFVYVLYYLLAQKMAQAADFHASNLT